MWDFETFRGIKFIETTGVEVEVCQPVALVTEVSEDRAGVKAGGDWVIDGGFRLLPSGAGGLDSQRHLTAGQLEQVAVYQMPAGGRRWGSRVAQVGEERGCWHGVSQVMGQRRVIRAQNVEELTHQGRAQHLAVAQLLIVGTKLAEAVKELWLDETLRGQVLLAAGDQGLQRRQGRRCRRAQSACAHSCRERGCNRGRRRRSFAGRAHSTASGRGGRLPDG